MNVKALIVEQIDWDATSRILTLQREDFGRDLWIAFPTEYEGPRAGPFYFQNPTVEDRYRENFAAGYARQIAAQNFYADRSDYIYKATYSRVPTQQDWLTYYALYLPEWAVPSDVSLTQPGQPDRQLRRTIYKDTDKSRYVIYLQCESATGNFSFNLQCRFRNDKPQFERSTYQDRYQIGWYDSPDLWERLIGRENERQGQDFLAGQLIINHGTLQQHIQQGGIQHHQHIQQTTIQMDKSKERTMVFIFGVVFVTAILLIAIFIPEPKPFQWNIFKTVIALAGAGVAAFIPGFLQVTLNTAIRAGGALAVFVVLFFFNPAALVVNYKEVTKKYNLTAFKLAEDLTAADFVINQVNQGDSAKAAAVRANAKERLNIIQNRMDELGIKINLKQLFEVSNDPNNVFPQSKFDVIADAINEHYTKNTVSYFKAGWYLTWLYVEGSVVTDPEAIAKHPDYFRQYRELYPRVALEVNNSLEQLGFAERVPTKFTSVQEIKQQAGRAQSALGTALNN